MSTTKELNRFIQKAYQDAILWAREVVADPSIIILDTETTGTGPEDEIIEISIINSQGQPLLDTLVRPTQKISSRASAIHGLSEENLIHAPTWPEIHGQVGEILQNASQILIYNVEFDLRLLRQTRDRYNLPPVGPPKSRYQCAMLWYAKYVGEWSRYHQEFRWHPLKGGHRALGDCLATLELIHKMAESSL